MSNVTNKKHVPIATVSTATKRLMFDVLPAPYDSWDPLLQKRRPIAHVYAPVTPGSTILRTSCLSGKSTQPTPTPASGSLMPPPPARASMRATKTPPPHAASPVTPAPSASAVGAPAPEAPVPTQQLSAAEMEAQSLALAYQLQQEEHAAFMQAVRVSSPAPPSGVAAPAATGVADDHSMDVSAADDEDDGMDESLRLAIRLQQEELQWHQAGSHAGAPDAGMTDDDSLRLAMELSQADHDDDDDDSIM